MHFKQWTATVQSGIVWRTGGVHGQYNEAGSPDAIRHKSLSADPRQGQSTVPAWLQARHAGAALQDLTPSGGSAGKAHACPEQDSRQQACASGIGTSHAFQPVSQEAPAAEAAGDQSGAVRGLSEGAGEEQGDFLRTNISQVLGTLSQAKGSISQAIGSIGQVVGGTPFSAFAQQSLRAQSHTSDDSEPERPLGRRLSAEPVGLEEAGRAGGSLGRRRSGPFAGRGVALGHMMAAQQQWRQESFTRAQVCLFFAPTVLLFQSLRNLLVQSPITFCVKAPPPCILCSQCVHCPRPQTSPPPPSPSPNHPPTSSLLDAFHSAQAPQALCLGPSVPPHSVHCLFHWGPNTPCQTSIMPPLCMQLSDRPELHTLLVPVTGFMLLWSSGSRIAAVAASQHMA